jgi:hypothetical protein
MMSKHITIPKMAKVAAIAPVVALTGVLSTGAVAGASPAAPASASPAAPVSPAPDALTAHRFTGTLNEWQNLTIKANFNPDAYVQRNEGQAQDVFDSMRWDNNSDSAVQAVLNSDEISAISWGHAGSALVTQTAVSVSNKTPIWDKHKVNYDITIWSGPRDGAWVVAGPFAP